MAEFDSGGFSAVSAFFNHGNDKSNNHDEKRRPSSHSAKATGARSGDRKGVGSAGVSTTSLPQQQAANSSSSMSTSGTIGPMIERVLKVGKRKRMTAEDDELDGASSQNDSDGDDDEEEEGRTAITDDSKARINTNDPPVQQKQSTKQKHKGKKERRAKEQASTTTTTAEVEQEGVSTSGDLLVENDEPPPDQVPKAKPKRRKVRSRQKNIYKDKRLAQHKPGHLIPGRPEFFGRPLTAETRSKLNLPPSRSSRQRRDDEIQEIVREETKSSNNCEGVKLAIDDLLDVGGEKVHKKKKKKKSKYKNLAF